MHDITRGAASQPYRTTRRAQTIARRLAVSDDGRTVTLRPLADVLTAKTRATIDALARRKAGKP